MRLELILPTWQDPNQRKMKGKAFRVPQLALPIIASVTPRDVEIHITDENVDDLDLDREVDLVGLSVLTATAPRAYEIADQYRARGSRVVMGGIHASTLPEEALQHADAVVIGEAEEVWPRVIEDAREGRLSPYYYGDGQVDLGTLPLPRRELLHKERYLVNSVVQVGRGCPYSCSFCTVTKFFGRTYRMRPVEQVVEEIRGLNSKLIGFFDDNIVGSIPYAKRLLRALAELKIFWLGQASLNFVKDEELLELLRKSGCKGLFIGLESVSQDSLSEIGKRINTVAEYQDAIDRIHDHGIGVEGAFIFGFDHDDRSVSERTVEFAIKLRLDLVQFGILTPFPGTRVRENLEQQGRLLDQGWRNYDVSHVVYRPQQMSPEELLEGTRWAWKQFYSFRSIFRRIAGLGKRLALQAMPLFILNTSYRTQINLPA
jgi:radical SAM superfamily enzyme YgiQ (UPF0313 family)